MGDPTRNEIAAYLAEVKRSVKKGRYRIEQNENRRDNIKLLMDYVISCDDVRNSVKSYG